MRVRTRYRRITGVFNVQTRAEKDKSSLPEYVSQEFKGLLRFSDGDRKNGLI